MKATDAIRLP